MMESLKVLGSINPRRIDLNNYFLSLFQEAGRVNLISGTEFSDLQEQLMSLLKELVNKYNGGNSTSIKVESAENLLLSMLYILNTRFLTYPQPETAVAALVNTSLREHYQAGIQDVISNLNDARALYREVLQTRIDTDLIAYNATLDEAIADFFAAYDCRYMAHYIPASIDYQLAWPVDEGLAGVSFIKQYLQQLLLENRFCQFYSPSEINRLLANYGQIYRIDYPEYLLNIFEIVFTNAILAEVLEIQGRRLNLPRKTIMGLYGKFSGKNYNQINSIVYEAWDRIVSDLDLSDLLLLKYIREWLPQLLPRLHLALTEQTLDKLFITEQESLKATQIISLEPGPSLDDEEFRELIEQVLCSESPEDKAGLILSRVHSWIDFRDVLNADCLYGDEYAALFAALGDFELFMLIKDLGSAELREGMVELSQILANFDEVNNEWVRQFTRYLNALSQQRISLIMSLIDADLQIT